MQLFEGEEKRFFVEDKYEFLVTTDFGSPQYDPIKLPVVKDVKETIRNGLGPIVEYANEYDRQTQLLNEEFLKKEEQLKVEFPDFETKHPEAFNL